MPSDTIYFPGNIATVQTVAALRLLPSASLNTDASALSQGRDTDGDGRGGVWTWVPASLETDNGNTIVKPADLTSLQAGRWKLVDAIPPLLDVVNDIGTSPTAFGAVGDGDTNDSAAFAAAIATDERVYVPGKTFDLTSTVTVPGTVSWRASPSTSYVGAGSINTPTLGGFYYFPNIKNISMVESRGTPTAPATDSDAVAAFVKHTDAVYPGAGLIQPAVYVGHHKYMKGPLDRVMGIYVESIDHAGSDGTGESYVEGGRFHGIQLAPDGLAFGVEAFAQMGDGVTDPGGRYTVGLEAEIARPLGPPAVSPQNWAAPDNLDVNVIASVQNGVMPLAAFLLNPYNSVPVQSAFMVGNATAATGVDGRKLVNFASFCSLAHDVPYGIYLRGLNMFAALSVANNTTIIRAANAANTAELDIVATDINNNLVLGRDASTIITTAPVRQLLSSVINPVVNNEMTIRKVSNTQLAFTLKGDDGVLRTGFMTLS